MQSSEPSFSKKIKLIALCVAWLVAFAAFVFISTDSSAIGVKELLYSLLFFAFFPSGLSRLFVSPEQDAGGVFVIASLILGWIIYITIMIAAFRTTDKQRYVVYYSILCILIIFNLIGCQKMTHDPFHI